MTKKAKIIVELTKAAMSGRIKYEGYRSNEAIHEYNNLVEKGILIIIDDEMFDITKYFSKSKNTLLVHTNGFKGGLTSRDVDKTLIRLERLSEK